MKIVLYLNKEEKAKFQQIQANFEDKPLIWEPRIDEGEQLNRLGRINEGQRNKLYVLFKEIADFTGDNAESVKTNLKYLFRKAYEIPEQFSLSNCTKELAGDFITFAVGWCLMNSIGLNTPPREVLDDDGVYFYLCNLKKVCCVCGDQANVITGNQGKKIALCGIHETELKAGQPSNFFKKYHVEPITMP